MARKCTFGKMHNKTIGDKSVKCTLGNKIENLIKNYKFWRLKDTVYSEVEVIWYTERKQKGN